MGTRPQESLVFIVRVWQGTAPGFRAAVRRVDEEQWQTFTAPDAVTSYLQGGASCAPDGQRPPRKPPIRCP